MGSKFHLPYEDTYHREHPFDAKCPCLVCAPKVLCFQLEAQMRPLQLEAGTSAADTNIEAGPNRKLTKAELEALNSHGLKRTNEERLMNTWEERSCSIEDCVCGGRNKGHLTKAEQEVLSASGDLEDINRRAKALYQLSKEHTPHCNLVSNGGYCTCGAAA